MNTLITAATTSAAYRLKNRLNIENIVLGDYLELPAIMLSICNMIQLPNPSSVSYAHEMLTLCLDKKVNSVYPLRENEKELLEVARQLFSEYGVTIVSEI